MRDRFDSLLERLNKPGGIGVPDITGETLLQMEIRSLEPFAHQFVWDHVIGDLENGRKIEPVEFESRLKRFVQTNTKSLKSIGQRQEAEAMGRFNSEAVAVIYRTFMSEAMPGIELTDELLESMIGSSFGSYAQMILIASKAAELDGSKGRYSDL